MTDILAGGAPSAAPIDVPVADVAPVVEAPAAPVEAPIEAPVDAPAEAPAADGAPEAPAAPEAPSSLLADAPGDAPADAAPQEPQAPEPISYEEWTLPEGLAMEPEEVTGFNDLIGGMRLDQAQGQQLMDYGSAILKQAQEKIQASLVQQQHDAWADTNKQWVDQFNREAGNARETIREDARAAIRSAVPDEKARQHVFEALAATGAGNHPAIINMLAAFGKRSRERSAPGPSLNTSAPKSAAARRYGPRA